MKVAIVEDSAFWVDEAGFWTGPVQNGRVIKTEAKPIDTENISREEMKFLFQVLDKLEQE